MTSPLAIHGGTPTIDRPAPHVPWPPIDDTTVRAVTAQLRHSVSIPDRSGVIATLEDRLAGYFDTRHAVLTSSGTAALHSAFAALGLRDGDEVLVPAYTFHATVTPLLHLRVRPVLVDCDRNGNIDPDQARTAIGPRTKALVVTHLWGVPAQMHRLAALAEQYDIALLEDGSHAHGATIDGHKVGTFGAVTAFSMNGPKPLSAGEGGFVLTNDDETYHRVLLHGQYNKRCRTEIPTDNPLRRFAVTGTGLKLRIHPLAAALARDQLANLDQRLDGRRRIVARMLCTLGRLVGIDTPVIPPESAPSWYALTLGYHPDRVDGPPIETVMAALRAEGCLAVDTPGSTCPLNQLPLFTEPHQLFPDLPQDWPRYAAGQFPRAETLHRSTIKITVPHDDTALADGYSDAIHKVINNLRHLRREQPE